MKGLSIYDQNEFFAFWLPIYAKMFKKTEFALYLNIIWLTITLIIIIIDYIIDYKKTGINIYKM